MSTSNRRGVAVALIVASPLMIGAAYSALAAVGVVGTGAGGLTVDHVVAVFVSRQTWRSVGWTAATAGAATLIASAAAVFVAVRTKESRLGQLLAVFPMAVPHVAAALAALLLFGQSGLLSRGAYALGLTSNPHEFPALVYDPAGVSLVIAFAWKEFPYLALSALAVLLTDTGELADVARTLGATRRQAFWRVTWPRLWRGTAPAALAAFAYLVGQYEMPALLAPSDPAALSLLTYERAIDPALGRRGEAHVLALLALGISLAIVTVQASWRSRAERGAR